MSRVLVAAFLACSLYVVAGYGGWLAWLSPLGMPVKGPCSSWLEQPSARWLSLTGCTLGVDELVLESDAGDLETLANRREGLATRPYENPPRWVAAWAPVATLGQRKELVRAVFRLEGSDLVAWLNAFERADERKREAMWADPVVLRRVAAPGVLAGRASKPATDAVQKAFGPRASAALLVVTPGEPPAPALPAWAAGALLLALGLSWLAWREFSQLSRGHAPTPEQAITNANVRDVKLELGELEALRREEAERRRRPGPD